MLDIDRAPGVFVRGGLRVEIMALWLQRRRVRIRGFDNLADSGDARLRAAGMIEKNSSPTAMVRRKLRA